MVKNNVWIFSTFASLPPLEPGAVFGDGGFAVAGEADLEVGFPGGGDQIEERIGGGLAHPGEVTLDGFAKAGVRRQGLAGIVGTHDDGGNGAVAFIPSPGGGHVEAVEAGEEAG